MAHSVWVVAVNTAWIRSMVTMSQVLVMEKPVLSSASTKQAIFSAGVV